LVDAISHRAEQIYVAGVSRCRILIAPFEADTDGYLLLGRLGDDRFSHEEATLLRVMGRSLALMLHVLEALDRERGLRAALEKRQVLFERLTTIQRSISLRAPLQEVLDTITAGARDLLGDEVASLRLIDPDAPDMMVLVSTAGLDPATAQGMRRTRLGSG